MTTSSTPVDATADALQVLRNRTFDEIAIGDSASLERVFAARHPHVRAAIRRCGPGTCCVLKRSGHHGGHLCKRPDLGCAGNTAAGAWNPICQPESVLPRRRFGPVTG